MSGWWPCDSASSPTRSTKLSASRKFLNRNSRSMRCASSTSSHCGNSARKRSASSSVSGGTPPRHGVQILSARAFAIFSSIGVGRSIGPSSGGGPFCFGCAERRKTYQDLDHLPVGGLAEIGIKQSDRAEIVMQLETNHVISNLAHTGERVRGGARTPQNALAWSARPRGAQRGKRGCAGRDAVVNHDRCSAADVQAFA